MTQITIRRVYPHKKDWFIATYNVPIKNTSRPGKIFAGIGRTEDEARENCIKDMRKDFAFIIPDNLK